MNNDGERHDWGRLDQYFVSGGFTNNGKEGEGGRGGVEERMGQMRIEDYDDSKGNRKGKGKARDVDDAW